MPTNRKADKIALVDSCSKDTSMGKEIEIRRGRLNETRPLNMDIILKTGIVEETSRPSRLKTEAWALYFARNKGLNVPQVLDYYRNQNGEEVLQLTRISGSPLTIEECIENTSLLYQVGSQMNNLDTGLVSYGWIDTAASRGRYESWKSFLSDYLKRYGKRLLEGEIIEEEHLRTVRKELETVDLSLPTAFLVHRDLRMENLLKDEKDSIWIIDWENAILGDPLYDLALFEIRYGKDTLWENLAKGYKTETHKQAQKYLLYKIIALIGFTDFYHKYNMPYETETEQLVRLISNL